MPPRSDYALRALAIQDRDRVLAWRNSERVRSMMKTSHIIYPEEHHLWFGQALNAHDAAYLIFEWKREPAGLLNFTDIRHERHEASWGFYIGREGTPPGTGKAMCLLGLEYGFDTLSLELILSEVLARNEKSLQLHLALGFEKGPSENQIVPLRYARPRWQERKAALERSIFSSEVAAS